MHTAPEGNNRSAGKVCDPVSSNSQILSPMNLKPVWVSIRATPFLRRSDGPWLRITHISSTGRFTRCGSGKRGTGAWTIRNRSSRRGQPPCGEFEMFFTEFLENVVIISFELLASTVTFLPLEGSLDVLGPVSAVSQR